MISISIFPTELLFKDKWDEVVTFLQQLPVEPRLKKQAAIVWTKYVGAVLTRDMIVQLLGTQAEEV